jgi:hypothetical protein
MKRDGLTLGWGTTGVIIFSKADAKFAFADKPLFVALSCPQPHERLRRASGHGQQGD